MTSPSQAAQPRNESAITRRFAAIPPQPRRIPGAAVGDCAKEMENEPNIFRGMLIALPCGLLLWAAILAAAWGIGELIHVAMGAAW